MLGPLVTALTAVAASLLGAGMLVPASATPDAETEDATPPQVQLDPCPDQPVGETCTRRELAWVSSGLTEGDDLAVAGALLDGELVSERVYDDGTGFTPYGFFVPPYNDVGQEVDHAEVVVVPPGLHEVTFFARDLSGNEATHTRSVQGPTVPTRPRRFEEYANGKWVSLVWSVDGRGSAVRYYVVRVTGQGPQRVPWQGITSWPGVQQAAVDLSLAPGRHVVRVFAVNHVGKGRPRSIVVRVPR